VSAVFTDRLINLRIDIALFQLSIQTLSLTFTLISSGLLFSDRLYLDLNDGDYELGLTNFETYHMISNVNSLNSKFYFDKDDKIIVIPEESYEIRT